MLGGNVQTGIVPGAVVAVVAVVVVVVVQVGKSKSWREYLLGRP
jgi:hypothetical protein